MSENTKNIEIDKLIENIFKRQLYLQTLPILVFIFC